MTFLGIAFMCGTLEAQNPDHNNDLDFYYNKAYQHFYTHKDSAYFYFDKVKQIAAKTHEVDYFIQTLISENWAANYHYDLEIVAENLKHLDSVLTVEKNYINASPEKSYYVTSILYSHALNNYELGNYTNALQLFEDCMNAIELEQTFRSDESVFGIYTSAINFIARMHIDEAKYSLAKHFLDKGLRLCETSKFDTLRYKNTAYTLLSRLYDKKGRYQDANTMLYRVLRTNVKEANTTNRIISNYEGIVTNHIKLSQNDSAAYYLKKMKTYLSAGHPFKYKYSIAQSALFNAEGHYDSASLALHKALEHLRAQHGKSHNTIAEVYMSLGRLDSTYKHVEGALNYYELAADEVSKDTLRTAIQRTTKFKALKAKSALLLKENRYKEVLISAKAAIGILDHLKPTFKNTTDKLFLIETAYPVFESGIEAAYQLYIETQNENYFDTAFYLLEKSKSVLLLEALLNAKATAYGTIPNEILKEEKLLKSKILHLEKQLNKQASTVLEDALFTAASKYRQLISNVEANYKAYYDLKYTTKVTSTAQLQEGLEADEGLVSYFYGKSALYGLFVSSKGKRSIKIPLEVATEQLFQTFQNTISTPRSNEAALHKISFQVFEKILAPVLKGRNVRHLSIIPDGILNYIPFSSLNTSKTELRYLLEDYTVRYGNSVTTLFELQQHTNHNGKVLSYAPSFTNKDTGLLPLAHNAEESKVISNYFTTDTYTGDAASLAHFNAHAMPYHMIHFATHAIFDADNSEYSFLAFTAQDSTKTKPHLLYIKDLYTLKLNANLITLSACQSGIGVLKRGEGLLSLARGFYFSGAKSIASTLWNINDASSAQLMAHFYKALAKGHTKPAALQTAKLEFLKQYKGTALTHPYYWSGFTLSGNKSPVVAVRTSYNWWILVGMAALLGIVRWIRKTTSS